MGEFKGQMQVPGVVDWPLSVRIELEEERITIAAAGYEVGNWSLDEIQVKNRERGFEVLARGEHFFVSTENDSEFALEVGMRRAIPNIGRRHIDGAIALEGRVAVHELIEFDPEEILRPREPGTPIRKLNVFKGRHERRAGRHIRSIFRRS